MKEIHIFLALWAAAGTASADLVISEIDLAGNKVEIINTGTGNENLTGYFLCNRLNGSPFYPQITAGLIDTANSDTTTLMLGPGQILTLQMTAGFIPDGSGEVGLYSSASFGSTTAMIDYVGWGVDGIRDSVAGSRGIWTSGTFIAVSGIQTGETIQLGVGLAGNSKDDHSLAATTIGENQVQVAAADPKVTSVSRSGDTLNITFTGPPSTAPASWVVMGSSNLSSFPNDKTAQSTITENPIDSGLFQATVNLSGEGDSYFIRIELP